MVAPDRKVHYSQPEIVAFHARSAAEIGLWRSEEVILRKIFPPTSVLLNVGCGAGRVSLALWELGYQQVLGLDFARPMVEAARLLASKLEYATPFRVGDVTRLGFDAGAFDGVIWLAAGIDDLADEAARTAALTSLRRITRTGGRAVITTLANGADALEDWPARFQAAGWRIDESVPQAALAAEPDEVTRAYAEVHFWVLTAAESANA